MSKIQILDLEYLSHDTTGNIQGGTGSLDEFKGLNAKLAAEVLVEGCGILEATRSWFDGWSQERSDDNTTFDNYAGPACLT